MFFLNFRWFYFKKSNHVCLKENPVPIWHFFSTVPKCLGSELSFSTGAELSCFPLFTITVLFLLSFYNEKIWHFQCILKNNPIRGVMVSLLVSTVVDRGFVPRLGQTKDYKISICCFWLARNQDNVSESQGLAVIFSHRQVYVKREGRTLFLLPKVKVEFRHLFSLQKRFSLCSYHNINANIVVFCWLTGLQWNNTRF